MHDCDLDPSLGEREIRRFLAAERPFKGAPVAALDELARGCRVRTVASGETIALRGEEVTGVVGVHSGFLKAFALARGRCFLGDVIGPGEWLGLVPVLRRGDRDFDLRAVGETRLVLVGRAAVEACFESYPLGHRGVALIVGERYDRALEFLQAHTFLDSEARMALRLTRLLDRHGRAAEGGGLTLPFRLSQEELGQMVGITREATGRCLRAWEKRGLVDLAYAQLVVRRPAALEQLFS